MDQEEREAPISVFTVIQLSEVVIYDILSKRGAFMQTGRRKPERATGFVPTNNRENTDGA